MFRHATAPCRARSVWAALACWALLALPGCGQPPSFELSWRIGDESWRVGDEVEVALPLKAVKQCSDVGIFAVRVTVSSGDAVVSVDEYPCFSSVVEGPTLEPGEYTIEVQGLRRNGEPWAFDPEVDLAVDRIAYASTSVTISDGALPNIEVAMRPPLGCDDGIDNDVDGTVDGQDPGCEIDSAQASEFNDVNATLFQLDVAFLESSVVKPYNVGVTGIRLEVPAWPPVFDGGNGQRPNQFEQTVASHEIDLSQWPFRLPLLMSQLESQGTLELLATAVGADGDLTATQSIVFSLLEGEGTHVIWHLEFGTEQFLQPIVEPIVLVFEPGCSPGGSLMLDRTWIRVTDENGATLDAATLGLGGSTIVGGSVMSIAPVDEADGWLSFECPSSVVTSDPLAWGHHQIEAQTRRAADTCFSSPVADLAPQPVSAQTITLERVLIDGAPACPECVNDVDCLPADDMICVDSVCVEDPGP